jgi:DNA-binding transcriptional LysR family regulator
VRRGEANIGLRYHQGDAPDLDSTLIASEKMQIVCAPNHRLAKRGVRSLSDLAGEHWLAFPDAPVLREISADSLFAQFLTRGIAELRWTAVDSLTAQKRLVEAGFGLALLPESAIVEERARGTLAVAAVGDLTATNPVHLVTRRRGYLSPAAEALIALLRDSAFADPAVPQRRARKKRR